MEMIMSNRTHIGPALLPLLPCAGYFHGLRVYHQLKAWRILSNSDLEPLNWSWQMKDQVFVPIMVDVSAGLEDILKVIRCSCKGLCARRFSCWFGLSLLVQRMSQYHMLRYAGRD